MEKFSSIALIFHVISGFSALLFGLIAIVTKKGKKTHKKTGLIFFYSMLVVSISGLLVSLIRDNQFLFFISIFTFFMNYFGYRSIVNKNLTYNKLDYFVLIISALNTILMIYTLNIILLVFGGISLSLVINEIRIIFRIRKNEQLPKLTWLRRHIGMMIGTYIATSTAFLIVNVNDFEPAWIPWLAPTFILSPLIFYFSKKFIPKK